MRFEVEMEEFIFDLKEKLFLEENKVLVLKEALTNSLNQSMVLRYNNGELIKFMGFVQKDLMTNH